MCGSYESISVCVQIFQVPRRSSKDLSGMRKRTCHDRKRTGEVHGAASVGPVLSGVTIQVQPSSIILSVQIMCAVGLSEAVKSCDGLLGEGSDRRLGSGRIEASGGAWIPRNQIP